MTGEKPFHESAPKHRAISGQGEALGKGFYGRGYLYSDTAAGFDRQKLAGTKLACGY